MPQMQCQQAVLEFVLAHPPFNFAGEFIKPAPARRNGQFVESLPEHLEFLLVAPLIGRDDLRVVRGRAAARPYHVLAMRNTDFFTAISPARPFRPAFSPGPDWAAGRRRALFHNASVPAPAAAAAG